MGVAYDHVGALLPANAIGSKTDVHLLSYRLRILNNYEC
jgi:hypothetical protein